MAMDNQTLIRKADLQLSDLVSSGGIMQPAYAQKFIQLLIDESVLMKHAWVRPMKAREEKIDKTRFASRVLRAAEERTALSESDRSKPDLGKSELAAKAFKAEVRLDDETLEDNIEEGTFKTTVMSMLKDAIARDMDEILVRGDTTSADLFLKKFNGVLASATSNIVNATDTNLTKTTLKNMVKTMPSPFLRDRSKMRFFTSIDAEADYADSLADRATDMGDEHTKKNVACEYRGIPVIAVPLFPENIGTGSHCTNVIFTDPKNIVVGVWRQITIKTQEDVPAGELIIVARLRFHFVFIEETAVVKATNVKVTS